MEFLATYLAPIIVLSCLVVGWIIKNLIPGETINRFIPLLVACLGIFLNVWYVGWTIDLPTILTGAISGVASTGLYEIFDQLLRDIPKQIGTKSTE